MKKITGEELKAHKILPSLSPEEREELERKKMEAEAESRFKRLWEQVCYDLQEFIPEGHFRVKISLRGTDGIERSDYWKRGLYALTLSKRLSRKAKSQEIAVTPRQSVAIELLYWLGDLATIENRNKYCDPDEDEVINNIFVSLEEYLLYFSADEAKPFETLRDLLKKEIKNIKPKEAEQNSSDKSKSWIDHARGIALDYINSRKKLNCCPTQNDVCDHVAKEMAKNRIYGTHKKPLSKAYIKRDALQSDWWQKHKP